MKYAAGAVVGLCGAGIAALAGFWWGPWAGMAALVSFWAALFIVAGVIAGAVHG